MVKPDSKSVNKSVDLGRAIARGVVNENTQKERNMQKAVKRKETMLHKAAESIFKDYSA